MKFNILKKIPEALYTAKVDQLHDCLGGPTLIHIEEGEGDPVYISTLLHGNEHSSFLVIQKLLNQLRAQQARVKRPFMIFIGNTLAAQKNLRFLPEQTDFNRVWNGGTCELASIANQALAYVNGKSLFCSVDIHNNSGKNPFYSCINQVDDTFLSLAHHFFQPIVYFTEPHEVQSMAFSKFCPSITIEAGRSGDPQGIAILVEKLSTLLNLEEMHLPVKRNELQVFHTIARMNFSQDTTIDFDFNSQTPHDFSLLSNIEDYNFRQFPVGKVLGYANKPQNFWAQDHPVDHCLNEYFEFIDSTFIVKKSFIPAMMTKDINVIKEDCFGYMMRPYTLPY